MKNKKMMKSLAILNICDFYITILLMLGRLGYIWKSYAVLLDLFLIDTNNIKSSYYFNIVYPVLNYFLGKDSGFLNQHKRTINDAYFMITIVGQSIFMVYFFYWSGYIPSQKKLESPKY
jgi:hypothetical protein